MGEGAGNAIGVQVGAGIPGEEGEGGNEEVGGLISCVKVHLRFTAFQVKIEEGIAIYPSAM